MTKEEERRKYHRELMRRVRSDDKYLEREQKRQNKRRRARRGKLRCFGCGKKCTKRIWRTFQDNDGVMKRNLVGYCGRC